jgi:hypothetical protein
VKRELKKGKSLEEIFLELNINEAELSASDLDHFIKKMHKRAERGGRCHGSNPEFPFKSIRKMVSREIDSIAQDVLNGILLQNESEEGKDLGNQN